MAKISTYPLDGEPKLSDKLIGTSVGYNQDGELLDPTYNFSLQQLLDLFLPNIPSNTLQGVLDYGNTATQDINLFGKITTTSLEVTNISNLFTAYISEELYIEGALFDAHNSKGSLGQILTSTGSGVEWITPVTYMPSLQEVLEVGNIADIDIVLTAKITADEVEADVITSNDELRVGGRLFDSVNNSGTAGQMLISLGSSVQWYDVPVYVATTPLSINPSTRTISIQQANGTQSGYLSFADWINFDGKQNALSGTGIVVSNGGTISYITDNSADWNQAYNDSILSASVSGTTTKTLTLTQRDGDVITTSWVEGGGGSGTLSSVGLSMPTAFVVSNSPLTSNGTIVVSAAGTALEYIKGDGTLGTLPSVAGFVPYTGATQSVDLGVNDITANSIIKNGGTSSQFLKADGSVDTNSYITLLSLFATSPLIYDNTTGTFSIQQANTSQDGYLSAADWNTFNGKQAAGNYITDLTGEASASGPGVASVVLNNAAVIAKVLTGLNVIGGSVVSTDTILQAFGKLQNQINGLIGGSTYQGTWNAATNTPALASGVGANGFYYIVSVAGNTNLDGITDWNVGDWAIFHGSTWQKVDNTDSVVSVNGYTGAVNLVTSDIPEGLTNLYFTDARARLALSFAAGSGNYDNTTGVITIPTDNSQILNGAGYITSSALTPYLTIVDAAATYFPIPTGTVADYIRGDGSIAPFPGLTGFVPYTGATTDVDLGAHYLKADYLAVSTTSAHIASVAEIVWNPNDGTFDMGLLNGVTLQSGQELHFYGKAVGAIANGQAVMFAGSQGDHLLMTVATQAGINANPEYFIGIATQDFANNDFGYITVLGKVRDLNTTVYGGPVLYFDSSGTTPGALTATMPTAPNAKIIVAAVVRVHATQGILQVRPHTMPKMADLQDVYAPGPVPNNYGLFWNAANSRYELNSIPGALGYLPAAQSLQINTTAPLQGGGDLSTNRTLSITQAGASSDGYLSSTDWNTFNNKAGVSFLGAGQIPMGSVTGDLLPSGAYIDSNTFKYLQLSSNLPGILNNFQISDNGAFINVYNGGSNSLTISNYDGSYGFNESIIFTHGGTAVSFNAVTYDWVMASGNILYNPLMTYFKVLYGSTEFKVDFNSSLVTYDNRQLFQDYTTASAFGNAIVPKVGVLGLVNSGIEVGSFPVGNVLYFYTENSNMPVGNPNFTVNYQATNLYSYNPFGGNVLSISNFDSSGVTNIVSNGNYLLAGYTPSQGAYYYAANKVFYNQATATFGVDYYGGSALEITWGGSTYGALFGDLLPRLSSSVSNWTNQIPYISSGNGIMMDSGLAYSSLNGGALSFTGGLGVVTGGLTLFSSDVYDGFRINNYVSGSGYQLTLTNYDYPFVGIMGMGGPMIWNNAIMSQWSLFSGAILYNNFGTPQFIFSADPFSTATIDRYSLSINGANVWSSIGQNYVSLNSNYLPNGVPIVNASEVTMLGVYDSNYSKFNPSYYAKRNIYCSIYTATNLLVIFNENSSVDFSLNVTVLGLSKKFSLRASLSIDWSNSKYSYKIISTNTTGKDDFDTSKLNFIFDFDSNPYYFNIQLDNQSGYDCNVNINANIS